MLFRWIDRKDILGEHIIAKSSAQLRQRWADQISEAVAKLHEAGVVWGDASPRHIIIDQDDNAWACGFGSGYTAGWVDSDKVGTAEGDRLGLTRLRGMLQGNSTPPDKAACGNPKG